MKIKSVSVVGKRAVVFLICLCFASFVSAASLGVTANVGSNSTVITVAGGTPVTVNKGTSQDFVDSNGNLLFTVTVNDQGQMIFSNVGQDLSVETGGEVDLGTIDVGIDNELVVTVDPNAAGGGTTEIGLDVAPDLSMEVIFDQPDVIVSLSVGGGGLGVGTDLSGE